MRLKLGAQACVAVLLTAVAMVNAVAQSPNNSQSQPPVSKSDVQIVRRARQILSTPGKWNRADNRICPATETSFSLYCALEQATLDTTGAFAHRGAAMQESRFVIDDDLAPNNRYHHRLMDYNNDPHTTFADVQRFLDLLQGRIEGRLEEQKLIVHTVTAEPADIRVTRTDFRIIKRVQATLDSRSSWDKESSRNCVADAKTYGLFCAFEAASLAVTGKPDYSGMAIRDTWQMISRTAPHASQYTDWLVDYNNDPTVTFKDMRALLQAVQEELTRQMALQAKH